LPEISLTNLYTDQAVDSDNDGLYDQLNIGVGVNVTAAGSYTTGAVIEGENESFTVVETLQLTQSDDEVILAIEGDKIGATGLDQSYILKSLKISDPEGKVYGRRMEPYSTGIYVHSDFENEQVQLTGSYTDIPVDLDGNGFFNYLQINVGIDVKEFGFYRVSGQLKCGEVFVSAEKGVLLSPGIQSAPLKFSGIEISKSGFVGEYELERVLVVSESKGHTAYCDSSCYSNTFDYSTFELGCGGDAVGDGDVDGTDLGIFANRQFDVSNLAWFATQFGRTDCPMTIE
jgi:hypothetical protein